ncbi:hypothetical protein B0H14DRAFT_2563440 [Mycena olivaceomarginata]|nr:hypothetical protein B0H14DRAFT_2563440 [Mycena olivaceomarginata]
MAPAESGGESGKTGPERLSNFGAFEGMSGRSPLDGKDAAQTRTKGRSTWITAFISPITATVTSPSTSPPPRKNVVVLEEKPAADEQTTNANEDASAAEEPKEEAQEEGEPEDPHPAIRAECESSAACAPMKTHFEKCQEKVQAGQGLHRAKALRQAALNPALAPSDGKIRTKDKDKADVECRKKSLSVSGWWNIPLSFHSSSVRSYFLSPEHGRLFSSSAHIVSMAAPAIFLNNSPARLSPSCISRTFTRISSRDALITTSSVLRQLESIAFPRFAGVRPYDAPSSLLSPCSYLIIILYPRRGLGRTMQAQRRPQPDNILNKTGLRTRVIEREDVDPVKSAGSIVNRKRSNKAVHQ